MQNVSEIAQDFWFQGKNAQFTTVLPFLGHLKKNCWLILFILFAQNFQTEILVTQKNFTSRKSGVGLDDC